MCGIFYFPRHRHQIKGTTVFFILIFCSAKALLGHHALIRISESTTGYTFTPCVGSFTFPGIDTRPLAFRVSSERHRQMWGERNCLSFETAAGGIEPQSSRLTVRHSTTQPPLPILISPPKDTGKCGINEIVYVSKRRNSENQVLTNFKVIDVKVHYSCVPISDSLAL